MPIPEIIRHPVETVSERLRQRAARQREGERLQTERFIAGDISDADRYEYRIKSIQAVLPVQKIGLTDPNLLPSAEAAAEIARISNLTDEQINAELQKKAFRDLQRLEEV